MIVIPNPVSRGVYSSGFYFEDGSVSVAAVTSEHRCLHRLVVRTAAELEAAIRALTVLLDACDPIPRPDAPPPPAELVATLRVAGLQLLS
jgi:hypothetical protein